MVLLAASSLSQGAAAETRLGSRLSLSGFGTIATTYNAEDGVEFRRTSNQATGPEGGEIDFGTDTRAGLQLAFGVGEPLSALLQGLVERRGENDWSPQLARAFVRWRPLPELSLDIGRFGYETFPGSESRNVGYAYLPLRPALVFGSTLPNDWVDGAQLAVTHDFDSFLGKSKLFCGEIGGTVYLPSGFSASLDGTTLCGVSMDALFGGWTLRAAFGRMIAADPVTDPQLAAALRTTDVPQAVALADVLDRAGRRADVVMLGAFYDLGPHSARLYMARSEADAAPMTEQDLVLVEYGHRFGAFTPFVQFTDANHKSPVRPTGLPDVDPFLELNAAAHLIQTTSQIDQRTLSLGVRYDFAPNFALKLQYDRVWLGDPDQMLHPDSNATPAHLDVTAIGLDFVF